jgi:hypothetical protein
MVLRVQTNLSISRQTIFKVDASSQHLYGGTFYFYTLYMDV